MCDRAKMESIAIERLLSEVQNLKRDMAIVEKRLQALERHMDAATVPPRVLPGKAFAR